ncbi:MAG TPA: hypothetical protein VNJ12_05060 [Candidatus Dormibacteraeota bacterium]|nr:hypothetical protein [Candidatus Dormibacteraeota bacterium]
MRIRMPFFLCLLCALAMSAPAWAKDLSTHFEFDQLTRIGSTQLKPGQYRFIADESTGQLRVMRNGKIVVEVKGQWIDLKDKSEYSEVMSTRNDIQEVLFAGKMKAIKFPSVS